MRRRYVYREVEPGKVECFEVGQDWTPPDAATGHKSEEEIYGKLQATDGTDISTKRRHREYMQANGLTVAEDYRDTWAKARSEREAFYQGKFDNKARREDIGRALYNMERGRK